jgi:hypothetical protein
MSVFNGIEPGYIMAFVVLGVIFWLSGYILQRWFRDNMQYNPRKDYLCLQVWLALLLFGAFAQVLFAITGHK